MKHANKGCCVIELHNIHSLPSLHDRTRVDAVALFLTHWRGSLIAVSLLTMAVLYVWGDYLPPNTQLAWGLTAFGNYMAQAFVFWKMERKVSLMEVIPRYMPWLLFSVAISGVVWGVIPWLVYPPTDSIMFYVGLFNIMLIFCVVNSPSNPLMLVCAVLPMMLLNVSALAVRSEWSYAGDYLILSGLILLYGFRVQAAIHNTMSERHIARDMAENLEKHQQQLVKVERENALLLERQRLMYDMHDGLGSTLLLALAAIEKKQLSQQAIAEILCECVEDLRLVIDSLEPMEHSLVTLLATIRYRIGQRLIAAGLKLEWDIHDLPELPWLEPPDALHVLRFVQEALTNVLKHANASSVRVTTRDLGDQVEINITDNGCGFDYTSVTLGRGLRSQMRRVENLGGELTIDSASGNGTSIRLRLPVERK
jgi:signal transduction histidine kinase